jgi:acetyl-CoA carboxylase biotin carboxyl carrier protein
MSDRTPPGPVPFSLDSLRDLVKLMEEHGLTEIDLQDGEQRCRLSRAAPAPVYLPAPAPLGSPAAVPSMPASAGPTAPAVPAPSAPASDLLEIRSPTVGTFYSAPSPNDPPYVKIGSKVAADSVVCLVEAMKVFNQITADVAGTVVEICVSEGDAVEYGQVLFRVRPG